MQDKTKAAILIAMVSVALAIVAGGTSWQVATENAEIGIVSLATEESQRLIEYFEIFQTPERSQAVQNNAERAAKALTGGLFDIAELYDINGTKLAESLTEVGEQVEYFLPKHVRPKDIINDYESFYTDDDQWILRVFVPIVGQIEGSTLAMGYFEGVRIVPRWEREEVSRTAWMAALIASAAAVVCGLAIYPILATLSSDNKKKQDALIMANLSMMKALGRAISKRDSDTGGHNFRVTWLSVEIAEQLRPMPQNMTALIIGSFLHDVGKIAIPDAILHKPGRLDAQEMAVMKTHALQGGEIVSDIPWLSAARDIVIGHHEKWDGSGYPVGLKGEAIPLNARIFAIADVFDALCSKRPYKDAMSLDAALAILKEGRGQHFDPIILDRFLSIAPKLYHELLARSDVETQHLLEQKIKQYFG